MKYHFVIAPNFQIADDYIAESGLPPESVIVTHRAILDYFIDTSLIDTSPRQEIEGAILHVIEGSNQKIDLSYVAHIAMKYSMQVNSVQLEEAPIEQRIELPNLEEIFNVNNCKPAKPN